MAVPTALGDLNVVIASNPPAGSDSTGAAGSGKLDDYLRAAYGLIAQVNAAKAAIDGQTFTGSMVIPSTATINSISAANITSSTYTPSIGNVINATGRTVPHGHYIRLGNQVYVYGQCDVDPDAAGVTCVSISLPVASDFAQVYDCSGSGTVAAVTSATAIDLVQIQGNVAGNVAWATFFASNAGNSTVTFQFGYTII
jgi:hypothetical protein